MSAFAIKQAQLSKKLHVAFEATPLEDGTNHLAERIIRKALQSSEGQQVFDWLENLPMGAERPSFAASVLRYLGRQTNLGTASWHAGHSFVRG